MRRSYWLLLGTEAINAKRAVKCKQLHVLHILAIDIQQQNEEPKHPSKSMVNRQSDINLASIFFKLQCGFVKY